MPPRIHHLLRILFMAAVMSLPLAGAVHATPIAADNSVAPNSVNELDCNGFSHAYTSVKVGMKGLCTDPIRIYDGKAQRAYDNGHYIGHDEPSIKFISTAPGTGNHMTYEMQLAKDPSGTPTTSGSGTTVSKYAELSLAPWFGLPICDPKSYPQNPCTPDSDTNHGGISDPNAAGSAFMELQFYAPGFTPFIDSPSCDATRYCVALTIDSLECTYNFASCNPNCFEPVNFAYLQRDGIPAGPPSPQKIDVKSYTPNSQTLMLNQGDWVKATIRDTPYGLKTEVTDLNTGQTGYMVASATNGFMNTNPSTCAGTPFDFHAEYNTAAKQNQVPWAALEGGVLAEQELGHFEPCNSVTHPLPYDVNINGQRFYDPNVYQTCIGGIEGGTGEGPCTFTSTSITCQNPRTEGDVPCPTNDPTTGADCEFSDAQCMPKGDRAINQNGTPVLAHWPVAGCLQNYFQNGDLDFDGTSYIPDWPDGSSTHPTPFRYLGPYGPNGERYPSIQFETDVAGSEQNCNTSTGAGCKVPPGGADFYPFWSLGENVPDIAGTSNECSWFFGNAIPGYSVKTYGRDAQYGTPDLARYGGTIISPMMTNPQPGGGC